VLFHDGIPEAPVPVPGVFSRVASHNDEIAGSVPEMMRPDPADIAVARCIFAFVTIMVALTISHVALESGFSNQGIHNILLTGALITGVILAVEYFGRKLRKSK
jgi:hypothetical protein